MGTFTFDGKTVVAPGILVRSVIGAQTALSLLPNGTLLFLGASDGGKGGGTLYRFPAGSTNSIKKVLRGGALYNAIMAAANVGAGDIIAVVAGTKTAASAAINGTTAAGNLAAGDFGSWTDQISFQVSNGSTSGFQIVFTWPDPVSGRTITYGGASTAFDNLADLNALQAAMLADPIITPPAATGLPAILTLTVTTNGVPANSSNTFLSGGTGSGSDVLGYSDVQAALDQIDDVAFDIGHLVGIYDAASQAYADAKATAHEDFGLLQRWIHQVQVPAANAGNTKAVNSAAVVNAGIGRASSLNSKRSNVCAQQFSIFDPGTGTYTKIDAAPVVCGLAALVGATDKWGPASPLTHVYLPNVADVDYPVLKVNGDQDRAISGGVMIFETVGNPAPGNVRCVQSVTTAPNDANGNPWQFAEFSCVRAADALLVNVKAEVETASPRALGGGNTLGTMNAIIAKVVNVLESALDAGWIVGYDKGSISIGTTGSTGSDDLVSYNAAITPPLNHLGVTQTLLPFQARVSLGGQVNG